MITCWDHIFSGCLWQDTVIQKGPSPCVRHTSFHLINLIPVWLEILFSLFFTISLVNNTVPVWSHHYQSDRCQWCGCRPLTHHMNDDNVTRGHAKVTQVGSVRERPSGVSPGSKQPLPPCDVFLKGRCALQFHSKSVRINGEVKVNLS